MCLFCKIINKEIPSDIIYEDEQCIAILDINPLTPHHTLVIPKTHSKNIIDTSDDVLKELIVTAKKIAVNHLKESDAKGFHIVINNNEEANQSVNHLHVHIIYRNDPHEIEYFKAL